MQLAYFEQGKGEKERGSFGKKERAHFKSFSSIREGNEMHPKGQNSSYLMAISMSLIYWAMSMPR
jgi:hypothetical protein